MLTTPVTHLLPPQQELEETFDALVEQWRGDTLFVSSTTEIVMHAAYQRIIGLGPQVLPFIFRELQARPGQWFWALHAITGDDPLEDGDSFATMTSKWLKWGREHGYIE